MLVTNYNGLGYDFLFEKLFLSLKIKRTMNQKNKNKNKIKRTIHINRPSLWFQIYEKIAKALSAEWAVPIWA